MLPSVVRKDSCPFPWSSARQLTFNVAVEPTSRSKLSSLADTREFENALASLLNLLAETRRQLQLREAELAAAVPVVSVDDDDQHLADRLHHVLTWHYGRDTLLCLPHCICWTKRQRH